MLGCWAVAVLAQDGGKKRHQTEPWPLRPWTKKWIPCDLDRADRDVAGASGTVIGRLMGMGNSRTQSVISMLNDTLNYDNLYDSMPSHHGHSNF